MYRERDVTLAYLLLMFAGYDYSGWYGSQPGYQLSYVFYMSEPSHGGSKSSGPKSAEPALVPNPGKLGGLRQEGHAT